MFLAVFGFAHLIVCRNRVCGYDPRLYNLTTSAHLIHMSYLLHIPSTVRIPSTLRHVSLAQLRCGGRLAESEQRGEHRFPEQALQAARRRCLMGSEWFSNFGTL